MRIIVLGMLLCPLLLVTTGAAAQEPRTDNPHGAVPASLDCIACHNAGAWKPAKTNPDFDHDRVRNFRLTGSHREARCAACHLDLRFDGPKIASFDCASCHADVHLGNMADACSACHNTTAFSAVSGLDIHARTAFPLSGAHLQVSCESCHRDDAKGAYAPLSTDCVSCHAQDYAAASLDHRSAGLGTDCHQCHGTLSWSHQVEFGHAAEGGFPLLGAHARIRCSDCHTLPDYGPLFTPTSENDCYACHQVDYQRQHPGDRFPTECLVCHGLETWSGASFVHNTQFPLLGAHSSLTCASCHTLPDYGPLFSPTNEGDCYTCHQLDYQNVHPGGQFPTDCLRCHTVDTWGDASFVHKTQFPLLGAHSSLTCASCHTLPDYGPLFSPTNEGDCYTCHQLDYQSVHPSGQFPPQFPTDCLRCHTVETWAGATFVHDTQFPLLGAHSSLTCASCHTLPDYGLLFTPTSETDCYACHQADHQSVHPGGQFATDCLTCHTIETWTGASFDHNTQFPLLGTHSSLTCASCHTLPDYGLLFTPTSETDCHACHQVDYQRQHPGSQFPTDCLTCHTIETWAGASFDHNAQFPLLGTHSSLTCASCHTLPDYGLLFTPTSENDCYACHQVDYQNVHPGGQFATDCLTCHTVETWAGASFDHNTRFPLLGAHSSLTCASCHTLPDYRPLFTPTSENDCYACHQVDYQRQHPGSQFPTDCLTCHTIETWAGATFDHNAQFPLLGAHSSLTCASCHTLPDYGLLFSPTGENDCYACHQVDYQRQHPGGQFPMDCLTCHTIETWAGASFDHNAQFPLLGAHSSLTCASCHTLPDYGLLFTPTSETDCYACHQADHQSVHPGGQFATDCLTCHTIETWTGASFDHNTQFPLLGTHSSLTCASCHTLPDYGLLFTPTSENDCYACHQVDYQRQHPGSQFPTDCLTCHTVETWAGATFVHNTQFPLLGAHSSLTCASCHTLPDYGLLFTPTSENDCFACHQVDYQNVHPGGQFATDCLTCHTVETWAGASFDHNTRFPLLGAHSSLTCASCHTLPDYGSLFTPTSENDCFACHQVDYQRQHPGGQFPTDCLSCHTVETWAGATFVHNTQFPLLGAHSSLTCASCHTLPDYGPLFTPTSENDCYTCHQVDYQNVHPGGQFPTDCLTCHTVETWAGASFDHNARFPLLGAHSSLTCASCHTLPDYGPLFTPVDENDCIACHQTDYQSVHTGDRFPTTCLTCHGLETWLGASFNHDPWFPISTGRHSAGCATCHVDPANYTVFTCFQCHAHDRSRMDSQHQGRQGYVYDSRACYNCHPNGRS